MSGRPGFLLWFTGMSGAGKSTLSKVLAKQLAEFQPVELLDGDEIRLYLSEGLTFSREDRDRNVRRIGYVGCLLARHGVVAIAAAISPYAAARDEVRRLAESQNIAMIEVHVHAELAALVHRDVKGLYRRALAGEIKNFTGVSDPYEPPARPEVQVRSDLESIEASAAKITAVLVARGLMPTEAAIAAPPSQPAQGLTRS